MTPARFEIWLLKPVFEQSAQVLVLQSAWIDSTATVLAAPLIPFDSSLFIERLTVRINLDGTSWLGLIHLSAPVARRAFHHRISPAGDWRDATVAALDYLFEGR